MKLSKKHIFYFSLVGAAFVALCLFTLYANHRTLDKLNRRIAQYKYQLDGQQLYAPLFQNLLLKIQSKKTKKIPFPKQARLKQEDTAEVMSVLQRIARDHDLQVEQLIPDVDSSIDGSRHLKININMLGKYLNLRGFLYELIQLSYFEHIEQIRVQAVEDARRIQLRIWMAKA